MKHFQQYLVVEIVSITVSVDILHRSRSLHCVTWLWLQSLWNMLSQILSATLVMARLELLHIYAWIIRSTCTDAYSWL